MKNQHEIEYNNVKIVIMQSNNQVCLYTSFNPVDNLNFIKNLRNTKNLEINIISNPGSIICTVGDAFSYASLCNDITQFIITNYNHLILR